MKYLIIILVSVFSFSFRGVQEVESRVYTVEEMQTQSTLTGESAHLKHISFDLNTISNGSKLNLMTGEMETLLIVKEGELTIRLSGDEKTIGPASVALALPWEHLIISAENGPVEFYKMEYVSKKPVDLQRGLESGGSFIIDFEDLDFMEHDRGGIRNYFNRPTAMMEYFEMHVTNLNGNIKSHEPHTHGAAEIVLMIKGNTEMQIGEEFYSGATGDVYFLGSEIPHAIENKDSEQCMYFAFQWE